MVLQLLAAPLRTHALSEVVRLHPDLRPGDVLVAEAVLRIRFGRSGLYDVTVRRAGDGDSDSDVIAEFRGRSHQLGPVS